MASTVSVIVYAWLEQQKETDCLLESAYWAHHVNVPDNLMLATTDYDFNHSPYPRNHG